MEKKLRMGLLFDYYGKLLTEKQQQVCVSYYLEDLSLQEIGEILGCSKQAVHDLLKRADENLEAFDEKLDFINRMTIDRKLRDQIIDSLTSIDSQIDDRAINKRIKGLIESIQHNDTE